MVYTEGNQTQRYPLIPERAGSHHTTTNQHFHDDPKRLEPTKISTFATLYTGSGYFMSRRLEKKPIKSHEQTYRFGSEAHTLNWSGRLPSPSYVGDGTFQLANGLTYSCKPVKLVPYSDLMKTEYQDHYTKKKPYTGYSVLNRSTTRF